MSKLLIAALGASLTFGAVGLRAQSADVPAAANPPAATATGTLNAAKNPLATIARNPKAKAALLATFPELVPYIDEIGTFTLTEMMPMATGIVTQDKIKALQLEFDKL